MKTLLATTSFSKNEDTWNELFGRWINWNENSFIQYDQILMVDDGSPILPDWEGITVINEGKLPDITDSRGVIYHFNENLGHYPPRNPGDPEINSPGWFRSFMFIAEYAKTYNFEKVIFIEADSFLISKKIQVFVNNIHNGWNTFWCPRHRFPECNIQIISGSSLNYWINWNKNKGDYDQNYKGIFPEFFIPFTNVVTYFKGDRWGEFAPGMAKVPDPNCPPGVPKDADYVCQVRQESPCWWID
jgi:hypothetical protein